MPEAEELILEIVNQNSGGMKFTKLFTDLLSGAYKAKNEKVIRMSPDEIEARVRMMSELRILEYSHEMRVKMFVYTP